MSSKSRNRHCSQCGKDRPSWYFSGYDRLSHEVKIYYEIAHLSVCNDCLSQSHRPRRLRILAGFITAEPHNEVQVKAAPLAHSQLGLSSRQKRSERQRVRKERANARSLSQAQQQQARLHQKESIMASSKVAAPVPSTNGARPAKPKDNYPDVLPAGATFVPAGFVIGERTGRIIRKPTDPAIPLEVRCYKHSEVLGRDVYHPWPEFHRDKHTKTHLRYSCKELHRLSPDARDAVARSYGQPIRADEARPSVHATPAPEVAPVPPAITPAVDSSQAGTWHGFISDVRVLMSENYLANVNPDYIDILQTPITLTELQRVGMFLLTQLVEATTSRDALEKANRRHVELQVAYDQMEQRALGAEGLRREVDLGHANALRERDELIEQVERLESELAQIKETASLDHDILKVAEASNEALTAQMKQIETLMRPFLGGRTIASWLNDMAAE